MPNLEFCPHLLTITTMTRRNVQANMARPTATDTCAQARAHTHAGVRVTDMKCKLKKNKKKTLEVGTVTYHKRATLLVLRDVDD